MHPIFATNYGNLYAFMHAVPLFILLVPAGFIGRRLGWHWFSIACGVLCAAIGAYLLYSLDNALKSDESWTIGFASVCILVGVVLMLSKSKRQKIISDDESKTA